MSLRNPDIYTETGSLFADDITLRLGDVNREIARKTGESDEEYVVRINNVINKGIAHYWLDEGIGKYNLRVPVWENYLLYLASFLKPGIYRKYEYADYRKAMERGVGLCSQQAIIVVGILNDSGIDAEMLGLDGHVVLRAKVSRHTWYVADPDYGVIIPHDISEIEANPELVRPYYRGIEAQFRGADNSVSPDWAVEVYGKSGNTVFKNGVIGYVHWKKFYPECLSYIAIWIIPLMMIAPQLLGLLKNRMYFW